MSIFQLIAILFGLFMLYVLQIHRKKHILTFKESIAWNTVWVAFILLSFDPQALDGITSLFHFARVFDLLLVMSLMVLSFVTVMTYLRQKDCEKKITKLVREQAQHTFK